MKLSHDSNPNSKRTANSSNTKPVPPTDEEIRLLALNRSKDKLLSIVSHDLRTSIGGVLTLSDMLEKRLAARELVEAQRLNGLIRRATLDADDLLKDLVAWTRKSGQDPNFHISPVDLLELVQSEVLRLAAAAQQKQQQIEIEAEEIGIIRADPTMLRSILRNLLTNALKFSYPEGQITVRIERCPGYWKFQVCDKGVGMSPEVQKLLLKLDDRKQRTGTAGETGSGFGLLLCQDLIHRHGGQLTWESILGQGSTFTFTIPELLA